MPPLAGQLAGLADWPRQKRRRNGEARSGRWFPYVVDAHPTGLAGRAASTLRCCAIGARSSRILVHIVPHPHRATGPTPNLTRRSTTRPMCLAERRLHRERTVAHAISGGNERDTGKTGHRARRAGRAKAWPETLTRMRALILGSRARSIRMLDRSITPEPDAFTSDPRDYAGRRRLLQKNPSIPFLSGLLLASSHRLRSRLGTRSPRVRLVLPEASTSCRPVLDFAAVDMSRDLSTAGPARPLFRGSTADDVRSDRDVLDSRMADRCDGRYKYHPHRASDASGAVQPRARSRRDHGPLGEERVPRRSVPNSEDHLDRESQRGDWPSLESRALRFPRQPGRSIQAKEYAHIRAFDGVRPFRNPPRVYVPRRTYAANSTAPAPDRSCSPSRATPVGSAISALDPSASAPFVSCSRGVEPGFAWAPVLAPPLAIRLPAAHRPSPSVRARWGACAGRLAHTVLGGELATEVGPEELDLTAEAGERVRVRYLAGPTPETSDLTRRTGARVTPFGCSEVGVLDLGAQVDDCALGRGELIVELVQGGSAVRRVVRGSARRCDGLDRSGEPRQVGSRLESRGSATSPSGCWRPAGRDRRAVSRSPGNGFSAGRSRHCKAHAHVGETAGLRNPEDRCLR